MVNGSCARRVLRDGTQCAEHASTIYYLPFPIHQQAMYENIKAEFDAGIVTLTLNRPEKLNALAGHMRRDLAEALEHAWSDPGARVVVIKGAGRAFCSGADVARMGELMEDEDVEEFKRLLGAGRRVLTAIRQMLKPVVASVNGPAYGAGFNLALACDIRLAAEF